MPVYRVSRPASSASRSVSSATAHPHYYNHHQYGAADDSTVSDDRSYTDSHWTSSSSSSGGLSRSHSARSLRTSATSGSSAKHRRHNYYDYYDYHDNNTQNDENIQYSVVDKPSHKSVKVDDDLSAYSPVYSVALRDVMRQHYDRRCGAYMSTTVTTSTRTVRKKFRDDGHDQIDMAIRCAQRTDEVVTAFMEAVDMKGWTMSVSVPSEGKATVTMTEYRQVPKAQKKKKRVTSGGSRPLHDILYANGHGSVAVMQQHNAAYYSHYEYDDPEEEEVEETRAYKVKKTVPALIEDVIPGTRTYICNSGWVREREYYRGYTDRRHTEERLLLALPHFSFHWSGGEFMIGSLRAAIDRQSKHITISAPTLMSKLGDVYGVEDIGVKGIRNFFYWNNGNDNSICRRFEKPSHRKMYYDATPKNIVRC